METLEDGNIEFGKITINSPVSSAKILFLILNNIMNVQICQNLAVTKSVLWLIQ